MPRPAVRLLWPLAAGPRALCTASGMSFYSNLLAEETAQRGSDLPKVKGWMLVPSSNPQPTASGLQLGPQPPGLPDEPWKQLSPWGGLSLRGCDYGGAAVGTPRSPGRRPRACLCVSRTRQCRTCGAGQPGSRSEPPELGLLLTWECALLKAEEDSEVEEVPPLSHCCCGDRGGLALS